ncbi:MAG: glycosyltransferase [Thermodesulfobacteriota bacterium]|nr:glycosyltransferase [Thermodesulfobacteriota bacterium]
MWYIKVLYPMKVLIISNGYPDYKGSYRGIFIQRLCLELKRHGVDVVVLTPKVFRQSPLFEEDDGIMVYRFWYPSGNKPPGQSGKVPIFAMGIYMISGILNALRLIIKERPDVIHGNWIVPTGLIAAIGGRVTNVPVVNTARGMDIRISSRGLIAVLFNLAVRLSSKITIVSPAMRNRKGLKGAEVISSGVGDMFFDIPSGHKKSEVIYTRSLEPLYDVEPLIRSIPIVFKEIPDVRFIIAGAGSQEEYLKGLAKDLGVGQIVEFSGAIPNEYVAGLMKEAKVFVSTATADGTSVSLLEAMAAGLIPVVSDIDANRLWITHGKDGYLFEAGNHQDLAKNIITALTDRPPVSLLEQKKAGLKERISWSSVAKRFIDIYTQTIKEASRLQR